MVCTTGNTLNEGTNTCEPKVCPDGQLLIGNNCQTKMVCTTGNTLNEGTNTCEAIPTPTCAEGQLLIAGSCVTKTVCSAGQQLNEMDNSCQFLQYWRELQSYVYVSGSESPLRKAFRVAASSAVLINRRSQAHMLEGLSNNAPMLIELLGAGNNQQYQRSTAPGESPIVAAYGLLNARDLAFFYKNAATPFITDSDSGTGIQTSQLRQGAWTLLGTGSGGHQDPLQGRATRFQDGIKEAVNTGKMHFYYGLNASLSGRHSSSNGCQHIKDYCIGAPHSFSVVDSGSTVAMDGEAATFAFAAYLSAWQRLSEHSRISAVFDMALACVDNLGVDGADDDTGLGRLDIGCLAYQAAQAPACGARHGLISRSECSYAQYWDEIRTHEYFAADDLPSPQQQAFAAVSLTVRQADRSDDAFVLDSEDHGEDIMSLVGAIGIEEGTNYTYMELLSPRENAVDGADAGGHYLYFLSSSDFINASWSFIPLEKKDVENGPWILNAIGNDGQLDAFGTAITVFTPLADTGKIHFYYGLDSSLNGRYSQSNGCQNVERHCFGAPYIFNVEGSVIGGTSFATPFAFATYLLAWEQMPANTHISAVFDLARSCVEDIGSNGADAQTGMGRLDIGCMAHRATQVPSCHPGHVLVSIQIATCARFSYWSDMRPLALQSPAGESIIERAFRDVILADQKVDRSANTHVLFLSNNRQFRLLEQMGITATVNYTSRNVVTFDDVTTQYINRRPEDLFVLLLGDASRFFTSNPLLFLPGDRRINANTVGSRARIITALSSSTDPSAVHLDTRDGLAGRFSSGTPQQIDSLKVGLTVAADSGRVHFMYALNDDLDGRHETSDGCQEIENYCIGVPYRYWTGSEVTVSIDKDPPNCDPNVDVNSGLTGSCISVTRSTVRLFKFFNSNYIGAHFGFASYLMAWERMPQTVTVADLFDVVRDCVEDIGADGADAQTGLGRLNIGCLAFEAYKKNNPTAVLSTVVIESASTSQTQLELSAYMDDFAQGLFANQLGSMSLPGPADARLQVGFAGDSFAGGYRPVQKQAVYGSDPPVPRHAPLTERFGLLASGAQVGGYYQIAPRMQAGVLAGRSDSFFGGTGRGQFEFSCSTDLRLLASTRLRPDADSVLGINGWLGRSRAGCISGQLLDSLAGSEAGLAAVYRRQIGAWRLQAQAWASRFVGGELQVAGQRFAIGSGAATYGGRLQFSYSF